MSSPSLRAQRAAFSYSDAVPLLADLEFQLQPGWTGLVGPNGAGKSTLLRLLAGELQPTSGALVLRPEGARIALCPQAVDAPDARVLELRESWEPEAFSLRGQLALEPEQLDAWPQLSPGERKRWQVGAALWSAPDVLLLDEPTNHLDAPARELLSRALGRFRGIGVLVSHDRALLEQLTSVTLRVADGTAKLYPGAYSAAKQHWERERAEQAASWRAARDQREHLERQLTQVREAQRGAERERSAGARMRDRNDSDARGLLANFKVEQAEKHLGNRVGALKSALAAAGPESPFPVEKELGRSIFVGWERPPQPLLAVVDLPELRAGSKKLLGPVRLDVKRDDRLLLTGPNGAGKSKLLSAIRAATRVPPERVLELPQELSAEQGRAELEAVRALPPEVRGRTLSLVAALGVDPARLLASEQPSPGEARKLALARGLGTHAWLLLLDEPTNHLDLPAIERLEAALAEWPGALVVVSHDLAFASALRARRLHLEGGELREHG